MKYELNENALAAGDFIYALRFLRLLTMDWEDTEAFKEGIIDSEGNLLKKTRDRKTSAEKKAYTAFHRLAFNIRKLIQKVPGGKSKLATYAAALFLIKEETDMEEDSIIAVLSEVTQLDHSLNESKWFECEASLNPGEYTLTEDAFDINNKEPIALKGTQVVVEDITPATFAFASNIYKVKHKQTNQMIYITNGSITR
jgi:hypothetical protein